MNSNKNIPQLRFPEFTGEWEEKPLSSFLHEHKTKSDGKCEVHSVSVTKGVVNQVEYLGRSFAAADTSKYNLVKPNDIIYTKSPTGAFPYGIVKQNKNPYNVIVSPLYAVYSPINKYVGYILDSYFESPERTNNYLSSLIQKGAKNTINISNDTFISKCMCLPSDPAEQQKIAECLADIDKLIAAQNEKVDALKEKKKGMMQQMFPQKGETTPRLRFPGFTEEWVEKKMGEIGDTVSGLTYSPSNVSKDGLLVLRSSNIKNGVLCFDDCVYVQSIRKFNPVKANDILICVRNGSTSLIGKCALIPHNLSAAFGAFMMVFRTKEWAFVFQLLQTESYREQIEQNLGARINSINSEDFKMYKFFFPPTPAEQQKIAECLSAMDDMIASESAKLDALKDHKKGLMQQLFPQPNK